MDHFKLFMLEQYADIFSLQTAVVFVATQAFSYSNNSSTKSSNAKSDYKKPKDQ
jgi:hypothetical protein